MIADRTKGKGVFMAVGSNLRYLREFHGMSQTDLARRLGVSYPRISEIEHGRANPKLSTLRDIADIFGITVAQLVDDKPPKRKSRKIAG